MLFGTTGAFLLPIDVVSCPYNKQGTPYHGGYFEVVLQCQAPDTLSGINELDQSSVDCDDDMCRFQFLAQTIKVLVVEGESGIAGLVSAAFGDELFYRMVSAETVEQALEYLGGEIRYAVCVLDVGMMSPCIEEFHLIKRFSSRTAFVALSGCDSLEKGFTARQAGAKAAMCVQSIGGGILKNRVDNVFLHGILDPPCAEGDSVIQKAALTFERHGPKSVAQWAQKLEVSETYLRRKYAQKCGVNPKLVLFLHTLYSMALRTSKPHPAVARRIKRYEILYRTRRDDIDQYLG